MKTKKQAIHPKIKTCLGYAEDMPDNEFLEDWTDRATVVCKPCWELKYCPYGPLVEDFPHLPISREQALSHQEYLKKSLATGIIGGEVIIRDEQRKRYQEILDKARDDILPFVRQTYAAEYYSNLPPEESIKAFNEINSTGTLYISDIQQWEKIEDVPQNLVDKALHRLEEIKNILKTGIEDFRKPITEEQRKFFQKRIDNFLPEEHPEFIPKVVSEAGCNVYGHICPRVFVGEWGTETTEERKIGRYISFNTKMRVVRRDNYTCQICGKHLKDNEVEFDHKIPISKGGSSEEHNIRLTCFECNREKSDHLEI